MGDALAEQVANRVEVGNMGTVVDLLADLGPLSESIGHVHRAPGRILACELEGADQAERIDRITIDWQNGQTLEHLRIDPHRIPLADGSCEAVVSLLTLGFADAPSLLAEARRIVFEPGHIAILVFDETHPPTHERILRDVLAAHGHDSPFLDRLLCRGLVDSAREQGYEVLPIRDLARFDGPGWFWEVMIEERPLGRELAGHDAAAGAAIRADLLTALRPYMAADDSIRIPVSAVLLRA